MEGQPDLTKVKTIDLERLVDGRMQTTVFRVAADVYDQMEPDWKGSRHLLLAQLVRLVEEFVRSDKIELEPPIFAQDPPRRRLVVSLNMRRVIQHVCQAVREVNADELTPVFDRDQPIRSTADMTTWYTGKPCAPADRSHVNYCVLDSGWEAQDARALDGSPLVEAWAKNDHLGFEVFYVHNGVVRKYRPDFLIRLTSRVMLVLEVKGREREPDPVKRTFMEEWCRAVTAHGGFGRWRHAVSRGPGEVHGILAANH